MGIGTSLVLIAIGAILKFAVNASIGSVELQTVGVILMLVGILGLIITLLFMTSWRDRTSGGVRRERYVERDPLG